jgi:hypothetical protein
MKVVKKSIVKNTPPRHVKAVENRFLQRRYLSVKNVNLRSATIVAE